MSLIDIIKNIKNIVKYMYIMYMHMHMCMCLGTWHSMHEFMTDVSQAA